MAFSVRVDGVPTFSVAEVGFYEGAEKLLELWFHLPDDSTPMGIRTISQYVAAILRVCPLSMLSHAQGHLEEVT